MTCRVDIKGGGQGQDSESPRISWPLILNAGVR